MKSRELRDKAGSVGGEEAVMCWHMKYLFSCLFVLVCVLKFKQWPVVVIMTLIVNTDTTSPACRFTVFCCLNTSRNINKTILRPQECIYAVW